MQQLINGDYMSVLPKDPINNGTHFYMYEPSNINQDYYLRVRLEKNGNWFGFCQGVSYSWCN